MSTPYMFVALLLLLGLCAGLVWFFAARRRKTERRSRWAGGLRSLIPEMTYTATGFARPVRVIFNSILRPATVKSGVETDAGYFRLVIHREQTETHLIDRLVLHPLNAGAQWISRLFGNMHNGRVNAYAAYALLALLLFLIIVSVN